MMQTEISQVRLVIANAFSVNMIPQDQRMAEIRFERVNLEFVKELVQYAKARNIEIVSVVGHEATARLLSQLLSIEVPVNRIQYTLKPNDILLVFTVPVRLPEGKVLSEQELREIADKLNIFIVYEIPQLEEVKVFFREFAKYLIKKYGPKEAIKLAIR